jgi:membrane protease subunit (stomatin/prohibitin family)
MNSDANAAADAERRWYANADQMASFLSGINSNWSQESWQNMLRDYLDMIKNAINEMLAGNFDDAVTTFTDIESQSMEMADIMTDGIVKQFPQYFR